MLEGILETVMPLSIFCPNNHLILNAARCPQCGWERPTPEDIGQPLCEPLELGVGLGGPGRGVFSQPGVAGGVVVFPSRGGELLGVGLGEGELSWRQPLDSGRKTRALVPMENRLLAAISDERSLGEAGNGYLVAVDLTSGKLTVLWEADGHQVSSPVLFMDQILLRTSSSALVALSREKEPREVWRRPLEAWWAQSPFVAEETVIISDGRPMHGEGYLKAFDLADGTPRWKIPTDGLLSTPVAATESMLVFRDGRHQLVGLSLENGEEIWKREYPRIYSPPVSGDELIFISVRGSAPSGEEGHYLLHALEAANGELVWECPLPARVRTLSWGENAVFAGSDHGHVLAYHPGDGKTFWEYSLGSYEDPIRTELVVSDDLLVVGTYSGKIVALRAAAPALEMESPDFYIEQKEYESAAAAYALSRKLRRAAKVYAQELQDVDKAFAIYEHGGLLQDAGELARAQDMNSEAREYFRRAGDLEAEAEMDLKMGDVLGAAKKYEQLGKRKVAAELYEQAGELRAALDLHRALGNIPKMMEIGSQVIFTRGDIEFLEKQGRLAEAGQAALKAHAWDKASKLFQELGDKEQELEALTQLVAERPEEWALERLAELARGMGKFQLEAQAWGRLKKTQQAAQAYHKAAQQSEQIESDNEYRISELYRKALALFEEIGEIGLVQECHQKVTYYALLPDVFVEGRPKEIFEEGGWNVLELAVRNVGRGIARSVCVTIGGEQFIPGSTTGIWQREALAPGTSIEFELHVQHNPEKGPGVVPLRVDWIWQDDQGAKYRREASASVRVRRRGETPSDSSPAVINVIGGDLIDAKGGTIEKVVGDKIVGDRVEGDKVERGGQKGDRVEIHRGEGVRTHAEGLEDASNQPTKLCPNCHLPVELDANFCQACRFELKGEIEEDKNE